MPLFQKSVLNKYLNEQDKAAVQVAFDKYRSYFHNPDIQRNILLAKEEQFQEGFLRELFVKVFGYVLNPQPDYNLTSEYKNEKGAKKADGAILNPDSKSGGKAVGVIELKSAKTKDLESIRQQAFDYKANQTGCVYVITSNFQKLRFYINDAVEFEEFDLFILSKERFEVLYLCLGSVNILSDLPLRIKNASILEEEQITKKFYADYSQFKKDLFESMVNLNIGIEGVSKLLLYKKTQKLLDRFLFIFFAEDRGLLPPNSISRMIRRWNVLKDEDAYKPLYEIFKQYFGYLNTGRKGKVPADDIHEYNGGLFLPDEVLDKIEIDDEVLLRHTSTLTNYDFESQVGVNILGHIFEHSLNEIESTTAELEGVDFDKQKSKRKKDGVFYTPKYITKYIVDNTVGKLCEEKKAELGIKEDEFTPNRQKETKKRLLANLEKYRSWLLELTICDPACGSGAFLNQALDFLINEHHYIDDLNAKLFGSTMVFQDVENQILENNIFGVDINEESVDIARLSLWLRTAQRGRKLTTLNKNIKCGNSLIDDPEVAGDKAFDWNKEFSQVFREKQKKAWHVTFALHNSRYAIKTDGGGTDGLTHQFYTDQSEKEPGFIAYTHLELSPDEEIILAEELEKAVKKYNVNILECNICADHVHSIIVCEEEELGTLVGKWKGRTAFTYNRRVNPSIDEQDASYADGTKEKFWAKSFHPKLIKDKKHLENTINYIRKNRQKHELPPATNGLTRWLNKMTCTHTHAFRTEYKGGFDVVIGNPPYTYRNAITEEEKEFFKKEYESIEGNFDLYKLFMEKIIFLNKDSGYSSFIVPNTFLSAKTYRKLRLLLLEAFRIIELFDLGLEIFENVVVESVVFTFKKEQTDSNKDVIVKRQRDRKREFEALQATYKIDIDKYAGSDCTFNINISDDYSGIIDKMKNDSLELGTICYCTVGINTGYIKNELTSNYKTDERYHKVLNGKDIGRYKIAWPGEYIMYDHDFVKSKGDRGRALPPEYVFTSDKILVQRTRRGMKRKLVCYLDNEKYFNLNRLSNIVITDNEFSLDELFPILNSKLLDFYFNVYFNEYEVKPLHLAQLPMKEICKNSSALVTHGQAMINLNDQLANQLNKLLSFILSQFQIERFSKKLQNWHELEFGEFIKELNKAIKKSGGEKLSKMDEIEWMEVFETKKAEALNLKTEIDKTDKEIDRTVYELYGLTEEEIGIVEGS